MDKAGPPWNLPENNKNADRVAERRPKGICNVTYANCAPKLLENGYSPLPINPSSKRPAPTRWTTVEISDAQVAAWANTFPHHGIGLRTGHLIGIDIDILDPDIAHHVSTLAQQRLGDTLMRVGQWPKRLLLYRSDVPFAKLSTSGLEVLGLGQQFVAFGIHPKTS